MKEIISIVLLIHYLFNSPSIVDDLDKIPNGKWICVQDSLSSIIVKDKWIYSYYNNKIIDTTSYRIMDHSCDSLYQSNVMGTLFLMWDNDLCYEIQSITEVYIELIYTGNGKTITYYKQP